MRVKRRFFVVTVMVSVVLVWLVGVTAVLSAARPYNATTGSNLIYSTFLGESGPENGNGITFDDEGNAYVVGYTESTIFPTSTIPLQDNHGVDVYVAKFNADGSSLDYIFWFNAATLFAEDYGYSIAVDNNGSAYVTGDTRSSDFCDVFGPTPGYDQTYNENGDAFALKINPQGTALEYCTFLGGNDSDIGRAIIVDEQGYAYVTGGTWSTNFPTTPGAFDTTHGGLRDAFVAKLDPSGTNLAYSTFLGADDQEEIWGIDLDVDQNIYVTGWTRSTNFYTTTGAYDTEHDGTNPGSSIFDGFLLKLDESSNALVYATFLGGMGEDKPAHLYVNNTGQAYVTGYTDSPDFPTTNNAFDTTANGNYDGFLLKMNAQGSNLIYSTFLGGSDADWAWQIDVDSTGTAYVVGETWSSDFPTTTLAFDGSLTGGQDAFVTQLTSDGSDLLDSTYLGGSDWDHGLGIAANHLGHVYVTGETRSADFPTTNLAYDTSHNGNYDIFVTKLQMVATAVPLQSLTLNGPSTGIINRPYHFTATVQPELAAQPITFMWQADGQLPITHTGGLSDVLNLSWPTANTYTLTVSAQNLLNSLTTTHTIVISSNVQASFSASPLAGHSPLTVTFTNESGGDFNSSSWDFGDGFTSTLTHPVHLYTDIGTYTVTLTASGLGGTDTHTRTAYITVQPFIVYLPLIMQ